MKNIYLDYSATTPMRKEVYEEIGKYFSDIFGNPSSIHSFGRKAGENLEKARAQIASLINANPEEIIFTSGGTEADNMAILGIARRKNNKGKHIITTKIEHHAVLNTCKSLEKEGFDITYLSVSEAGLLDIEEVKKVIRPDTILISVMHVNNEVGTILPIQEIGKLARENDILFHVDAVQSFGKIPIDVINMNIDMLSASSHKIYGPKGIGCLYVRKGIHLQPLMYGGAQENKKRPGTENVPAIIGFGLAADLAGKEMKEESKRLTKLRDKLIAGILNNIPHCQLNGDPVQRLPGNANISIKNVEGESLLLMLDLKGIAVSSGSACTSGSLDPSHVLLAMGISHEVAQSSLRFTLGKYTTEEDIEYVLDVLPEIVEKLRSMSPLTSK